VLAERETLLKQQIRLSVLEAQEASVNAPKPVTAKPAKPNARKKASVKTAKANGVKHVPLSVGAA
jgi:hypothetical protein